MRYPQFCGPSYTAQSMNFRAERTVNWFPSLLESGEPKYVLDPSPGTVQFADTTQANTRGAIEINGRAFCAAAAKLYELNSNGTVTDRGDIANGTSQVSFAASNTELVIASENVAYSYILATNTLAVIAAITPSMVAFADGYFLALDGNQTFYISSLNDATTWDAADVGAISIFPDNLVSMIASHREIILPGRTKGAVYYDSGNPDFPWEPRAEMMEQGLAAQWSIVRLDNSIFWLGRDENGHAQAWRADGYTPKRVSTHAIELAFQGYATISDAIAYTFQENGHPFYHLHFPTANASWRYDVSTGLWHEVGYWTGSAYVSHHSRWHIFCFGKHLVGDWNSGKVYNMASTIYDDNGDEIRRLRRAPHINNELKRTSYHSFQLDMETGVGLVSGQGTDPQVNLRWSDNGGHTWSSEYAKSAGLVGAYSQRVIWRRLGQGRNRVFEINCSDPVPWRIQDAYLELSAGVS